MIISLLLAAFAAVSANAQDAGAEAAAPITTSRLPAFVSLKPNINDYTRFADGGPDGNWYIGFNSAWIVRLPPAPTGDFTRAFIGARVGRAKTRARAGRGWDREAIPGKIYMGISQSASFSSEQSFFLAETSDLPLEADARSAVAGIGQSQWFWTEVPIGLISTTAQNYLVVWSPTEEFTGAANAPILAAADHKRGAGEEQAWLNQKIQGVPPRSPEGALQTPINNLAPALAIKLVPVNDAAVGVNECSAAAANNLVQFQFSVDAENAQTAWVELSSDQVEWKRISGYLRQPPYHFSLANERLLAKGGYLRAAAQDQLGNLGYCDPVFVSKQR